MRTNDDAPELFGVVRAYSRFNGGRALGSGTESELRETAHGTALVLTDPARRGGMCNRVLGFGAGEIELLPEILEAFQEAGTEVQIDLGAKDSTADVEAALGSAGLRPGERLRYLYGRPEGGAPVGHPVERWGPGRGDEFLGLLKQSGVECEPEVWKRRRRHYCSETFRTFVVLLEGEPRGWATSYVWREAAYFANAYVLEPFRRRGGQTALLGRRLRDAAALGLEWVVTDVIADSESERNCRRAGLDLLEEVTLWRREPRWAGISRGTQNLGDLCSTPLRLLVIMQVTVSLRARSNPHKGMMELPFYLMSPEAPGASWDGLVSLHGDDLHFELKGGAEEDPTEFDLPLKTVTGAQFQRGLVSRKLCLTVEAEALRSHFPAGVCGQEVHLMVARDDPEFGSEPGTEREYERLAGEIAERGLSVASGGAGGGLAS